MSSTFQQQSLVCLLLCSLYALTAMLARLMRQCMFIQQDICTSSTMHEPSLSVVAPFAMIAMTRVLHSLHKPPTISTLGAQPRQLLLDLHHLDQPPSCVCTQSWGDEQSNKAERVGTPIHAFETATMKPTEVLFVSRWMGGTQTNPNFP